MAHLERFDRRNDGRIPWPAFHPMLQRPGTGVRVGDDDETGVRP